jgi:hypothetical protein
VQTRLDVYPGALHGVWVSFPELAISKKAIVDSVKGLAWLLDTEIEDAAAAEAMNVGAT